MRAGNRSPACGSIALAAVGQDQGDAQFRGRHRHTGSLTDSARCPPQDKLEAQHRRASAGHPCFDGRSLREAQTDCRTSRGNGLGGSGQIAVSPAGPIIIIGDRGVPTLPKHRLHPLRRQHLIPRLLFHYQCLTRLMGSGDAGSSLQLEVALDPSLVP